MPARQGNVKHKIAEWSEILRVLKVIAIILAVIVIATIAYTFPTNVNKELDGVIFRLGTSDKEYCIPVKVLFDGYVKNTINGKTYKGDIIINNSELDVVLLFDKSNRNRSTLADYDFDMDGQRYKLSTFIADSDFEKLAIAVYDNFANSGDTQYIWSSTDGMLIVAPAKDRIEAVNVAKEILSKHLHIPAANIY